MRRTIVTAFLSIAGGKVIEALVMLLVTPIIVRLLGSSAYGRYATVMAVFGLLMILVSSGINSGTRKYIAEEREDDRWKDQVFGYYFRLAAALAFVASALLLAAAQSGIVSRALGEEFAPYFYLLGVLTVASQFGEYTRRTIMGLKLEHISEPIRVMHKVTFGVSAIALTYLGFGVAGVLAGHIIASGLVILVSLYFIAQQISLRAVFTRPPDDFPKAELFSFNHLSIVYVFLLTSLYHVDVLMLEAFTTSQQVGYYKIALVVVQFLWFVPRSIQSVMIQSTSNLWAQGQVEKVTQLSSKVTRYTLTFTALLAVGLAVLAEDFVPLYAGPEFTASVLPLLLLLPGTLGFAMARPILAISHAKGDLRIMILATGAAAVLNLLLNFLLIPRFGIEGAAVATSVGYGALPLFHIWGARTMGYRPLADARLPRIALTAAVTGAVIYPIAGVIDHVFASLLIVPPVGFVVYAVFTLLTGTVDVSELFEILDGLPAPISSRAAALERRIEDGDLSLPFL